MIDSPRSKQFLLQWLESQEQQYNPELQMLTEPFSSPGYHTTLKDVPYVHKTRESLAYAVALLNSGAACYQERACAILEKVISLQETRDSLPTYGIWPWFYEEPLDQMAPPDWNWADFCGRQLLLAALHHTDVMSSGLQTRLREAVFRACEAIITRHVGPGYTNIAIMGAFVTLLAGELYDHKPFLDYGLQRLRSFYAYTLELGTFEEYNSPTYTTVAIEVLSSLLTETKQEPARQLLEELLDIAWRMVAEHYHVPTRQWSGPHSRSYDKLLAPKLQSFLQLALEDTVIFLPDNELLFEPNWYNCGIRCPERYRACFTQPHSQRQEQLIYRNNDRHIEKRAALFMNETCALGSFDKEIMWNQRRNLLAYLVNGQGAAYMQLQFLHDGYDYAAAVISSRQEQGDVLAGISFSTNGGDTHSSLDRINGSIQAEDMRLRLAFGGCLDGVQVTLSDEMRAQVQLGGHAIGVEAVLAEFPVMSVVQTVTPKWEWQQLEGSLYLDLVLYHGPRTTIDFAKMDRAGLLFSLRLTEKETSWLEVDLSDAGGFWTAECMNGVQPLQLTLRQQPATVDELLARMDT